MKQLIYKRAGLFCAVWALIIFILCSTPGRYIPSANWLDLLSFDKWVHASIFFILCSLAMLTVFKNNGSGIVLALSILGCIAYGGLLEIMQARYFSERSADWQDFIANSFGCLVAFLLRNKMKRSMMLE